MVAWAPQRITFPHHKVQSAVVLTKLVDSELNINLVFNNSPFHTLTESTYDLLSFLKTADAAHPPLQAASAPPSINTSLTFVFMVS